MATEARHSFSIGADLAALLTAGQVRGANRSERLDRLAARYSAMVVNLIPNRWTPGDWAALATAAEALNVDRPEDVLVLAVRLRTTAKNRAAADPVSLAYRFENLRPAEQLACLDITERLIAASARTPDEVKAWFDGQGLPTA